MDILEAIDVRISCRAFTEKPVEQEKIDVLAEEIRLINRESGLSFQLYGPRGNGDGTAIVLPADARCFDYDLCAQYCVWRRPYSSGGTDASDNYSSHDLGLEVAGLSVPTLAVTNGAAALRNLAASRTVAVGAASILAGGVWDNATTVDSALSTVGSLAFAENAVWHVTLAGAATVARTFSSLVVPSALGYQVSGARSPGNAALISGPAALAEPAWTAVLPTRGGYAPLLSQGGTGFALSSPGMTVILR